MLKYFLAVFGCMLMCGDVSAGKDKRVHFSDDIADTPPKPPLQRKAPSDLKLVMSELVRKAETLQVELNELPFYVLAKTIRQYQETKPNNSKGVSDTDYFALFEKVYHKIISSDSDDE